jgi:hypothetical protein
MGAKRLATTRRRLGGFIPMLAFCSWSLAVCSYGQWVKPETGLLRSFSGQFNVRALPPDPSVKAPKIPRGTNENLIHLDPTLVTISCERIKQLVFRELAGGNNWRGKIFLGLAPAGGGGQPITILSEKFRDSWQYRMELPDLIERGRYVRAIVQVLLLEFANRTGGGYSAEIPVWLSEGFAQYLLASNELEIILPPPRLADNGIKMSLANANGRRTSPVEAAFAKLKTNSPLSFYELSWPVEDEWSEEQAQVFRSSAQLFFNQLLQLKEGRECLRGFISRLTSRLNWQLAFLDSFHVYFSKTLDVEKWWALQMVQLGRRNFAQQTWSFEESRRKLEDALRVSMQIHTGGGKELPLAASVTLATFIRDSNEPSSAQVLTNKTRELTLLRSRLAPEFIPLLEKYRDVLDTFLQQLDKSGKNESTREVERTAGQLEELDALRVLVRPQQKAIVARKR